MRRFTSRGSRSHVDAVDHGAALVDRTHPLDHLERGRLAGAVRPEDAEHLALRDLEAHAVDGDERAVALAQVADDDDRRARRLERSPGAGSVLGVVIAAMLPGNAGCGTWRRQHGAPKRVGKFASRRALPCASMSTRSRPRHGHLTPTC